MSPVDRQGGEAAAIKALREIRVVALNEGRPEVDDFAHRVYELADKALADVDKRGGRP